MTDWDSLPQDLGNVDSDALVKGPFALLITSVFVVLLSCVALAVESNWAGYSLGVVGSGACIFTAAVDQRRQASANYSSLIWFSPAVRIIRWLSTLVTLAHIVFLAKSVGGR